MAKENPPSITAVSILHAIDAGHRYGFDIMDATGLPSGTVYPALTRLERNGLLRWHWEHSPSSDQKKRPARRSYELTRKGLDELARAREMLAALGIAPDEDAS